MATKARNAQKREEQMKDPMEPSTQINRKANRHEKRRRRGDSKSAGGISKLLFLFVSFCAFSWPTICAAAPFSFDDIEFWVGEGENRAALVIDWVENSAEPPALAWGFRWDGSARGSDMLAAIVAADPRLVAKVGGQSGNLTAVYGLGYDTNNDNNDEYFKLAERDEMGQVVNVTMPFDEDGYFYTGPADGEEALDDEHDYYAEGWFGGFWHYGIASSNPYDGGSWSDDLLGMTGRVLNDGAWDSWAFTPTFNFAAFAENPQAATPPDAGAGDFNGDGSVDAADYVAWRHGDGSPESYDTWRMNFGATTGSSVPNSFIIPEPTTASFFAIAFLATQIAGGRKPRRIKSPLEER